MKVKITIARSTEFCFCVEMAIGIALKAAEKHSDYIDMLGDIVHNGNVCKDVYRVGIKKIKELTKFSEKIH